MVAAFRGLGVVQAQPYTPPYRLYSRWATTVAPGGSPSTGAQAGTKGANVNNPMDVLGARNANDVDHPTGPDVGQRLPDIALPDQSGRPVNIEAARDGGRALVVFHRSLRW